jgi:hypothetical protein
VKIPAGKANADKAATMGKCCAAPQALHTSRGGK